MEAIQILDNVSVVEKDGEFYVTSLQIAEHFEKEHKNVLRDIDLLELPKEFSRLNFEPSNYKDSRGKNQRMVLMTRDGFVMLAMGFTGAKAMDWKIRYIQAFNAMEKELTRIGGAGWLQKRIETKLVRRPLTNMIQRFVSYAIDQGSQSYAKNHSLAYVNFTKMEYKALFLLSKSIPDLRDKLAMMELNTLMLAEQAVTKSLGECMDKNLYYKEIYQVCKNKVEQLAELVGVADKRKLLEENNPFAKQLEEIIEV